jgi:Flp pilus assembly pilin Flp
MTKSANQLWNDEAGFIVSIELILIATIAIIGLISGLAAVRDAVVSELSDVAGAIQDLNQSYTFQGVLGHAASTAGSDFNDALDFCDSVDQDGAVDATDNCIEFSSVDPTDEA